MIFRSGDKGDRFYIILSGSVGVHIKLPSPSNPAEHVLSRINQLKQGASFGEIALLEDCLRTATIIAGEEGVELAYMLKSKYQQLISQDQKIRLEQKIDFLKQYAFFRGNCLLAASLLQLAGTRC